MLSTDAAPFEQLGVPIKHSYEVTSRRYLTRLYATESTMSRALESVRGGKSRIHGRVVGALFLKKGIA